MAFLENCFPERRKRLTLYPEKPFPEKPFPEMASPGKSFPNLSQTVFLENCFSEKIIPIPGKTSPWKKQKDEKIMKRLFKGYEKILSSHCKPEKKTYEKPKDFDQRKKREGF